LKKRTKKLLSVWRRASVVTGAPVNDGAGAKVFASFFQKRRRCSF
jgi:hypothetical protein